MLSLRKAIASLARNKRKWDKRTDAPIEGVAEAAASPSDLEAIASFGSNPGNLLMRRYLPPRLAPKPALVVVLHGCKQSGSGYERGAGWSTLADRYGFALLVPEQQRSNNANLCFNWFLPQHAQRGRGEAASIREMIEKMVIDQGIDRDRVFITGLSAGGAMTSVMLACYPEVFAGGAIIAGLPYGAARNVQQAFESMFQGPSQSARHWGDLVRAAAAHRGPWPRVSVWHGSADKIVIASNAQEILKQWTDIHHLPLTPSREGMVDGYPRKVWVNAAGEEVIESFTLNSGHGTPLATGGADGQCGVAGPLLLDVGISSSYHIAKFFGLTEPDAVRKSEAIARADHRGEAATLTEPEAGRDRVAHNEAVHEEVLEGEVLDKDADVARQPGPLSRSPLDIGAVITRALTAAGLMKASPHDQR
jgi:poly(hydroxyalkanoate) depolymerase family esterase